MSLVTAEPPAIVDRFREAATAHGSRVVLTTLDTISDEIRELIALSVAVGTSEELGAMLSISTDVRQPWEWDTWFSIGVMGVAATGTIVVAERVRSQRLPTLLCRRHVLVLASGALVPSILDLADTLRGWVATDRPYLTLVSGPSRTADIEKVLTIGAHGPALLDIYLLATEEN